MREIQLKNLDIDMAEIDEIKFVMKNANTLRLYKRYSVLLKHFEGFTNNDIARMECLNPHTVGIYINNYKEKGLVGLKMSYSTGAKRKLNSIQEQGLTGLMSIYWTQKIELFQAAFLANNSTSFGVL